MSFAFWFLGLVTGAGIAGTYLNVHYAKVIRRNTREWNQLCNDWRKLHEESETDWRRLYPR